MHVLLYLWTKFVTIVFTLEKDFEFFSFFTIKYQYLSIQFFKVISKKKLKNYV